jgi:hypothetical protein
VPQDLRELLGLPEGAGWEIEPMDGAVEGTWRLKMALLYLRNPGAAGKPLLYRDSLLA